MVPCSRLPRRRDSAATAEAFIFIVEFAEVVIFVVGIVEAFRCLTFMHYTYFDMVDRVHDVGKDCSDVVNSAALGCIEAKLVFSKEAGIRELGHEYRFVVNLAIGRKQG